MIEIIKTYYGVLKHMGASCKVTERPAYRCTDCGFVWFGKRQEHTCKK